MSSTTPRDLWLDTCILHQWTIFITLPSSNFLSFAAKEPHCLQHAAPWSMDICATQSSPVHRSGWTTLYDFALSSTTPAPPILEWPCQGQCGSGITSFAPVSDVSTPAYANGVWHLLWLVSVAQKDRPLTMLSSSVQSIDLHMDCTAWSYWVTRQSNGCATPVPRSNAANRWIRTRSNDEKDVVQRVSP